MSDTLIDNGHIQCPNADHVGAFRQCPHGAGIDYRAVREPTGPAAVTAVLRTAYAGGHIDRWPHPNAPHVAVLDVYDAAGIVVDVYRIPTPHDWSWLCAAIEFQTTESECDRCNPDAFLDRPVPGRLP